LANTTRHYGIDMRTIIKCLYRRNLKMSPEKLSSQIGHVCFNLGKYNPVPEKIIVLKASNFKFQEQKDRLLHGDMYQHPYYIQVDQGLTEVEPGTETVLGWVELID